MPIRQPSSLRGLSSRILLTGLIGTLLPVHASGADLEYVDFPLEGQSGEFLTVTHSTIRAGDALAVRYVSLPEARKHFLVAFIAERGTWRTAPRREVPGKLGGTWQAPLDWAGEYLVCVGLGPAMSLYGRTPQEFDECLRVYAVWGDPSAPPRPTIELSTDVPVAGERFQVRYADMPIDSQAEISIVRVGTPVNVRPDAKHSTRGSADGAFDAVLHDGGRYELRLYYEALGRQVRATLPISVAPSAARGD